MVSSRANYRTTVIWKFYIIERFERFWYAWTKNGRSLVSARVKRRVWREDLLFFSFFSFSRGTFVRVIACSSTREQASFTDVRTCTEMPSNQRISFYLMRFKYSQSFRCWSEVDNDAGTPCNGSRCKLQRLKFFPWRLPFPLSFSCFPFCLSVTWLEIWDLHSWNYRILALIFLD